MWRFYLSIIPFAWVFIGCKLNEADTLFTWVPAKHTQVDFVNQVQFLDTFTILDYMYFFDGGGVAIGDINNDGLDDLFFVGNQVSSRLYLNLGDLEFKDITASSGTGTKNWCSGVNMIDINADGWLDIYVCRTGLPLGRERANLLFINNRDTTFTEVAEDYGIADTTYSTQSAFFDYDRDGDLDLYLLNHSHQFTGTNIPTLKKKNREAENTDKLLRQDQIEGEQPFFTDVSESAGITIEGFGLGVAVSDINKDGWPDVYVSNDFISNDLFYINNKDGTFTNQIMHMIKHQSHNGMGCDVNDMNNDGWPDIFVGDMLPATNRRRKLMGMNMNEDLFDAMLQRGYESQYPRNTLQLNVGDSQDALGGVQFSEIGQLAGIHSTDWSWAGIFSDFDNDGWKDLVITNGYLHDITDLDFIAYRKERFRFSTDRQRDSLYLHVLQKMPSVKMANYGFRNRHNLTFENVSGSWGLKEPSLSNGVAVSDLDLDGDLDLVINNINQPAFIYRNNAINASSIENHYLKISLVGQERNPGGIGTKISIYHGKEFQYQEYQPARGYQSAMTGPLHFGLAADITIDSLHVVWPDQKVQTLYSIKADQTLELKYGEASPAEAQRPLTNQLMEKVDSAAVFGYRHEDGMHQEFKIDRLIPHKFGNNGPGISVGDMDGNGLEDVYIGGASGFKGTLIFQHVDGFKINMMHLDSMFEDMGSLLLDVDNDHDLDLYVVSGGAEFARSSPFYQDRLYINGGDGSFERAPSSLPEIRSSGSCVVAEDIDLDGDLDLFVGGRIIPGKYPDTPDSYLLLNEGGKFIDVTESWSKELRKIGLVTGALWSDVDNDHKRDLLVVGEWMPFTVFKNTGFSLEKAENTDVHSGWWNSIIGGDFDEDGDTDYVLGNRGLNSILVPDQSHPVSIYFGDFDLNQSWDAVLAHYVDKTGKNKKQVPFHSRDQMISQMASLQKKFPNYESYATASIQEVIPIQSGRNLHAYTFESSYVENRGSDLFQFKALPIEAQFSPIYGMQVEDINLDGHLDILAVGNFYESIVDIGRYDASFGLVLAGDGTGGFTPFSPRESGFYCDGNTRALTQFIRKNSISYIATCNQDKATVWTTVKTSFWTYQAPPSVSYVLVYATDRIRKVEFYRGEGYLTQSSRSVVLAGVDSIQAYDVHGRHIGKAISKKESSIR